MATQYTPILQLALPVTGELNGTWGDVVNDNITSMVEEAIAGLATISTWTANSHTLTTADGTTDEARCAMLVATTGSGGTALSAAGEIICPARTKLFVLQNNAAYQVTLKTASGTGIAVAAGDTAFLFCDGTNVNACVTQIINGHITGNLTVDGNATVNGNTTLGNATSDTITANARIASDLNPSADNTYDLGTSGNSWRNLYIDGTATIATLNVTTIDTTNLEVTNIKAKDGTAAITLADSTGVATLSANPILNAGTANGVAYLNGSKVLTTGSALTFDGTNLGLGTSPSNFSGYPSITLNGTSGAIISLKNNGTEIFRQSSDTSGTYQYTQSASQPLIWGQVSSELMRLTSTGLGIGTSSPGQKLHVVGNAAFGAPSSANSTSYFFNASNTGRGEISYDGTNNTFRIESSYGGSGSFTPISFWTSGAEKMRLDSSGNLGLGVTPSAHAPVGFGGPMLQVGNRASLLGSSVYSTLTNNVYYANGFYRYIGSDTASMLEQSAGAFRFFTAPSGTAGNAISFTQAMTLDASGALGIGTTSMSSKLHIANAGDVHLTAQNTLGNTSGFFGADAAGAYAGSFTNHAFVMYTNSTERMRIDSSGNVGIGTSSPSYKLHVSGSYIYQSNTNAGFLSTGATGGTWDFGASAGNFVINQTGTAERMRIDSSGNLLVGTTSGPGTKLTVAASVEAGARFLGNGLSSAGLFVGYNNAAYIYNDSNTAMIFGTNANERMRIDSSGNLLVGTTSQIGAGKFNVDYSASTHYGISINDSSGASGGLAVRFYSASSAVGSITTTTTTTAYNTSSDYRLKENIQPMQNALGVVAQLNPVTYTWKADGSDGQGFIAHELQAVVPDCVTGEKDAVDADGKPVYQGVDTSFLVATLTAAIQELKAELDATKAEVAALKAK